MAEDLVQQNEEIVEEFIPATGNEKPKPPTDDEMGDALLARWNGDYAYFFEQWHSYSDGIWKPTQKVSGEIWDTMIAFKSLRVNPTSARAASIESYLKARLLIPIDRIDRGDAYLNLRNGLFNLQTLALEPHRRDLYLTVQLGFDYDPDVQCPTWEQFVRTALVTPDGQTDPSLMDFLHEAMGYSLTTDTHFEAAFWLYGEAATGKSTILKVLSALLGTAFVTLDFGNFEKNPYQLAHMPGKRVVACFEASTNAKLADNILKSLISGEELLARQIYKSSFNFRPTAKLWWAFNHAPQNNDTSNAIYRRIRVIPFNHPVPREQQDRHLLNKLLLELSGIFNLALAGLLRLREQGDFTVVQQVVEAVDSYREENDIEAAFLADVEWCLLDEGLLIQSSDLYIAYRAWCERFGYQYKSQNKAAKEWVRLGLTKFKNGTIQYRGIGLTPEIFKLVDWTKKEKRLIS